MVQGKVLTLNFGSSSVKLSLYEGEKEILRESGPADGSALTWIMKRIGKTPIAAVVHRVVHGGSSFTGPVLITREVISELRRLIPFAPLHQRANVDTIDFFVEQFPRIPQVACFDTAFHSSLPARECMFALPRSLYDSGIRRYGFHGLSYEYIAQVLAVRFKQASCGRTIVCHLGAGSSVCALQSGKSIATTMGLTPLDGIPMATRCGAVDPGVVLYLLKEWRSDHDAIADMLYKKSGLYGLSGISGDMKELLASPLRPAQEAIEIYCYRAAGAIASLATALRGLDCIVFTGGIGEHSAEIRQRICFYLDWLGVELDDEANKAHEESLSVKGSKICLLKIPTNEELVMAQHAYRILEQRDVVNR